MQEGFKNPYVVQMDKFTASLHKLSQVFLSLEEETDFISEEQNEDIYESVKEKICNNCGRQNVCEQKDGFAVRQMLHQIYCVCEEYGAELNVDFKRSIQERCVQAPRFLRKALEEYRGVGREHMWNRRMEQSREGYAFQLNTYAQMVQHATKELDACIFADDPLEKRLKRKFSKEKLRLISTVFFVSPEGRYEIHVTCKVISGKGMSCSKIAEIVSECVGRTMTPTYDERPIVGTDYVTIEMTEVQKFHVLHGVARVGKDNKEISGDSFSTIHLKNGKEGMFLSDGMGTGKDAEKCSSIVVELLEDLMEAGFLAETALQMINTMLVTGRKEVKFSTIDMCIFDLYQGKVELIKAGASLTLVKRKEGIEKIRSTSLPLGVVARIEPDYREIALKNGDMVIMLTDGVLDAFSSEEQEVVLQKIVEGAVSENPKELAQYILKQVTAFEGGRPKDDMTVLVAGIWSLEK